MASNVQKSFMTQGMTPILTNVMSALTEAESKAKSSGKIQTLDLLRRGQRQDIYIGKLMVLPPAIMDDPKDVPLPLLNGAACHLMSPEDVAYFQSFQLSDNEYADISKKDYQEFKDKLFRKPGTSTAYSCVLVFQPAWGNIKDYKVFQFIKDPEKMELAVRHLVFSAYFRPSLSALFETLEAPTIELDAVNVQHENLGLSQEFSIDGEKQYPELENGLEKTASKRRPIIRFAAENIDAIQGELLGEEEKDVLDCLQDAIVNKVAGSAVSNTHFFKLAAEDLSDYEKFKAFLIKVYSQNPPLTELLMQNKSEVETGLRSYIRNINNDEDPNIGKVLVNLLTPGFKYPPFSIPIAVLNKIPMILLVQALFLLEKHEQGATTNLRIKKFILSNYTLEEAKAALADYPDGRNVSIASQAGAFLKKLFESSPKTKVSVQEGCAGCGAEVPEDQLLCEACKDKEKTSNPLLKRIVEQLTRYGFKFASSKYFRYSPEEPILLIGTDKRKIARELLIRMGGEKERDSFEFPGFSALIEFNGGATWVSFVSDPFAVKESSDQMQDNPSRVPEMSEQPGFDTSLTVPDPKLGANLKVLDLHPALQQLESELAGIGFTVDPFSVSYEAFSAKSPETTINAEFEEDTNLVVIGVPANTPELKFELEPLGFLWNPDEDIYEREWKNKDDSKWLHEIGIQGSKYAAPWDADERPNDPTLGEDGQGLRMRYDYGEPGSKENPKTSAKNPYRIALDLYTGAASDLGVIAPEDLADWLYDKSSELAKIPEDELTDIARDILGKPKPKKAAHADSSVINGYSGMYDALKSNTYSKDDRSNESDHKTASSKMALTYIHPAPILEQFYPEVLKELRDYPGRDFNPMMPDVGLPTPKGQELSNPVTQKDYEAKEKYTKTSPEIAPSGPGTVPLRLRENSIRGPFFSDQFYKSHTDVKPALMVMKSYLKNKTARIENGQRIVQEFLTKLVGEIASSLVAAFMVSSRPLFTEVPGEGEINLATLEGALVVNPILMVDQGPMANKLKSVLEGLADNELTEAINNAWAQSATWSKADGTGFLYEVFVRVSELDTDTLSLKYEYMTRMKK